MDAPSPSPPPSPAAPTADAAAAGGPGARDRGARPARALVVLGCKVTSRGLSPAATRRVEAAAAAFHRTSTDLVVVCGGRRWGDVVEAVAMGRALEALDVPRERMLLELASLSTLENARFADDLLRARGIRDVSIVTCDWHVSRALRDFESFGFAVIAVPAISPPVGIWARWRRDAREACSEALDARLRARGARFEAT